MSILRLLLIVIWIVVAEAHFNDQVCARSNELTQLLCSGSEVATNTVRPRPGKKGEKGSIGPRGVAGERGPPGIIDHESVGNIVEEKLMQYDQKIEKLNLKLEEVTTKLAILEKVEGKCPVRYNSTCSWGIFRGMSSTNQQKASDLCENEGGRLAGVYSEDHLNQLFMYALPHAATKTIATIGNIWMWTGMKYENGHLIQRDGSIGPTLKWSTEQIIESGTVKIRVDVNRENEGLVRANSGASFGTFCEIDI